MTRPVLLHGFTGSAESWVGVVDGLGAAETFPVFVDLPGHGRHAGETDPERFTLEAALEAVSDAGRWPEDLVGYSMGGRIALHFAARYPDRVRRLVLESASPGLETEEGRVARRGADAELADRLVANGLASFVLEWERLPLFGSQATLPPEVRSRIRAQRMRNNARSLAAALHGLGAGALPALWRWLPALETPTLLIVGEADDKFVDIGRRMAGRMPNAELVIVPNSGHTVHLERPDAWMGAVSGFLERR